MAIAMKRPVVRRVVATATGVMAAALVLAGCSGSDDGGEASGEVTTIRLLHAAGDETFNNTLAALAEDFNAQSETTIVELEPLAGDYATAMKTVDATGNWPAIVDMRDTLTYVNAGKLAAMPEEVTELVDPSTFGAAEDGVVYTVPSGPVSGDLGLNIVYDKDYFEENNLEVPTTYDEFITLMEDIEANGDGALATAAGDIWPSEQLWKLLASSTFAEYSDAGGYWNQVAAGEASLEDLREPLEKLQYVTDEFVIDGWISTADPQLTTLLVNDQAQMITSSAGVGRLKDINNVAPDFNAGMFIVPADDGMTYVLENEVAGDTAAGFAISSQAYEDGAEYDSAVEFLKYFYSVPAGNLMQENGMIGPYIVNQDDIVLNTSIPGSADYYALTDNPNMVRYVNTPHMTTFSTFNSFWRQVRIEMQDGQITIDEAIDKAQAEFDKQLAASE